MSDTVHQITGRLKGSKRVIIYSKAERNSSEIKQMLEVADEVIPLPNIGREGETYLVSLLHCISCSGNSYVVM